MDQVQDETLSPAQREQRLDPHKYHGHSVIPRLTPTGWELDVGGHTFRGDQAWGHAVAWCKSNKLAPSIVAPEPEPVDEVTPQLQPAIDAAVAGAVQGVADQIKQEVEQEAAANGENVKCQVQVSVEPAEPEPTAAATPAQ